MGGPGDPVELTVTAESAFHSGFVGYRTYGTSSGEISGKSETKAASGNILHAVSKRTAEADLRSLAERSPVESDLLDGGTWTTGR